MSVFRSVFSNFSSYLVALFAFSIITNLMILAPSFHMLQVYDRVLASGSKSTLLYITLIAIFALCVYGVAETIRTRVAQRMAAKYTVSVSDKMFAEFAQFPNATSATSKYLQDYQTVRMFLASRVMIGLFDLPFIPLYLTLLFLVHWLVGLITLIGVVIITIISLLNGKLTERSRTKSRQADSEAVGFAQSAFSRSEEVRSLGLLPNFITLWGIRTASALGAADEAAQSSSKFFAISRAFRQILQVCIMATGAFLVLDGSMSGGLIFMASMISGKALAPVEQVIGATDQISKAMAAYQKIEELTGTEKGLKQRPPMPDPKGKIEAHNLVYVPPNAKLDQRLVDRVTVAVEPGELLLIFGPIGSGKSTLVRMLAGAITPSVGEVSMDGAPISQWPSEQWGRAIGYVSQEIELFPGTVAENISRFDLGASQDDIYKAAVNAGVHDMIVDFPDGYQTKVGGGMFNLSLGQKQQIALARAFYGSPKVLILDEPNSSLDQAAEGRLLNCLMNAKKRGLAIIIISQRNIVMKIADHVLRMDGGRAQYMKPDEAMPRQRGMNGSNMHQSVDMGRRQIQQSPPLSQQGVQTPLAPNVPSNNAPSKVERPKGRVIQGGQIAANRARIQAQQAALAPQNLNNQRVDSGVGAQNLASNNVQPHVENSNRPVFDPESKRANFGGTNTRNSMNREQLDAFRKRALQGNQLRHEQQTSQNHTVMEQETRPQHNPMMDQDSTKASPAIVKKPAKRSWRDRLFKRRDVS